MSALTVIWHALSVFLWIIVGRARCTLCKSIVPPFLNAARYGLLRSQPRFIRRLVRDAPGNARAIRATIIFSRGRGEDDAVYPKSILPSFLPSFLSSFTPPPPPNFDRRSGGNSRNEYRRREQIFFDSEICRMQPRWVPPLGGETVAKGADKVLSVNFCGAP